MDTAEGGDPIEDDDALHATLADAPRGAARLRLLQHPGVRRPAAAVRRRARRSARSPDLFKDPVLATLNANEHGVRLEATLPESLSIGVPAARRGRRTGGRAAGRLVARPGAARPRQDDRLASSTRSAPSPAAATRSRSSSKARHRPRPGQGRDRLDGRLEPVRARHLGVRAERRARDRDERRGGLAALHRRDRAAGAQERPMPTRRRSRSSSRAAARASRSARPDVPEPIHLFQRDGKVVLAYGDAAAADALDPAEKLGDTPGVQGRPGGARRRLRRWPSTSPSSRSWRSWTPPGAGDDEGWLKVKPYLEPLGALVVGAQKDGDKLRSAFGITVK